MKTVELSPEEVQAINGGYNAASSGGAGLKLGAGSLLSLGFDWSDGQGRSYQSKFEIGKDIHLGAGVLSDNTHY